MMDCLGRPDELCPKRVLYASPPRTKRGIDGGTDLFAFSRTGVYRTRRIRETAGCAKVRFPLKSWGVSHGRLEVNFDCGPRLQRSGEPSPPLPSGRARAGRPGPRS